MINFGDGPPKIIVELPEHELDRTFEELEIDSLARVEMVLMISDNYHITISNAEADALETPRAVLELVAAKSTNVSGAE
ncbi:acyl carrier protein [Nocardia brasiliensis]|uniref:acyl carrier protein n=1 Tax=Nocardia brasiliensis TaxID=37326 RepID=UPI00192B6E7C|nr:acyl carrier protein [Nocardia brasiliensis]